MRCTSYYMYIQFEYQTLYTCTVCTCKSTFRNMAAPSFYMNIDEKVWLLVKKYRLTKILQLKLCILPGIERFQWNLGKKLPTSSGLATPEYVYCTFVHPVLASVARDKRSSSKVKVSALYYIMCFAFNIYHFFKHLPD